MSAVMDCAMFGLLVILISVGAASSCGVSMATLGRFRLARVAFRYLGWPFALIAASSVCMTITGMFEARLSRSSLLYGFDQALGLVSILVELAMLNGIVIMNLTRRTEGGGRVVVVPGSRLDWLLKQVDELMFVTKGPRSICSWSWGALIAECLFTLLVCVGVPATIIAQTVTIFVTGRTADMDPIIRKRRLVPYSPLLVIFLALAISNGAFYLLHTALSLTIAVWLQSIICGVLALAISLAIRYISQSKKPGKIGEMAMRARLVITPTTDDACQVYQARDIIPPGILAALLRAKDAACPVLDRER